MKAANKRHDGFIYILLEGIKERFTFSEGATFAVVI